MDTIDFTDLNDWQPLDVVVQKYPQFNKTQFNWLLRQKERNGLAKIVKKIGKRNYIHVPGFSVWISQQ